MKLRRGIAISLGGLAFAFLLATIGQVIVANIDWAFYFPAETPWNTQQWRYDQMERSWLYFGVCLALYLCLGLTLNKSISPGDSQAGDFSGPETEKQVPIVLSGFARGLLIFTRTAISLAALLLVAVSAGLLFGGWESQPRSFALPLIISGAISVLVAIRWTEGGIYAWVSALIVVAVISATSYLAGVEAGYERPGWGLAFWIFPALALLWPAVTTTFFSRRRTFDEATTRSSP